MSIKTNEREIASKVAEWINDFIKLGVYPFEQATNETGIKTDTKTCFGDIIIWKNREAGVAYSYIEIKPPFGAKENLETFKQKAIRLKVKYAFTWDFQNLNIYKVSGNEIHAHDSIAQPVLSSVDEWLRGDKQVQIKKIIGSLCSEMENLNNTGKLKRFSPEKVFFINLIREAKDKLIPEFEKFIKDQQRKGNNRSIIDKYVIEQGISMPNDEAYYRIIASQRVYGLITKVIFYLTIRRHFKDLPDLIDSEEPDLNRTIQIAFAKASEKDWQAVFLTDPIEELGIPSEAETYLRDFFQELKVYHFDYLKEDVIGELFEEIVDPNDRHSLGQFFTREDLVDFVIATVVNDKNGYYSDPTCGSGTFLIRLYDRLKYLGRSKKHEEILDQIWGIDIGKFPAKLSTINLFRQQPHNFQNFPRVLNKSIFDIHKGFITEFPPPFAGTEYEKIKVSFPEISAFVGNFPFIRQELIEKKVKGFKDDLTVLLAEEYILSYPKLFEIKKEVLLFLPEYEKYPEARKRKWLSDQVGKKAIQLKLSGQADIYAYIYMHTASLLARQGKFAIITSNSWLDVAYGSVLKEFFLDNFKIHMVVASWAESWFDDAAVNTVITVLEKRNTAIKETDLVKFVKLKQKFEKLIPQRDLHLESIKRWERIDGIVRLIENAEHKKGYRQITKAIGSYETDEMRIRTIRQSELAKETEENGESGKWGKYLRAPDVYFEILEACKDKLVPLNTIADIKRGTTTGINDFFYLEKIGEEEEENVMCKNSRGWQGRIEKKYLRQIIKSPKEAEKIRINRNDLRFYVFACPLDKQQLKKNGDVNALQYIEWGEKQKTKTGVSWTDVPSVSGRAQWWKINTEGNYQFLISRFFDKKFLFPELDKELLAGDTYFVFAAKEKEYRNKIFLNSTVYHLFVESQARNNMGDGLLTFYGPDIEATLLLDDKYEIKYDRPIDREIRSIFEEVKQKDRRELDTAVLEAMGLDAKEWLPKVYDGICEMVSERLEVPKMRKKQKKEKEQFSYEEVKNSVVKDVIGNATKVFPELFYSGSLDYHKLEFDFEPFRHGELKMENFFGHYVVKDEEGKTIYETDSEAKAGFACILARYEKGYILKIPKKEEICLEILSAYKTYVDELTRLLIANAQMKLHDWMLSEKMAKEILRERNILY